MSGKLPNLKKLRSLVKESDDKFQVSSENTDKIFLGEVKREIEELDRELCKKKELDDLSFSSESEKINKSSFELSLSSDFSTFDTPDKVSEDPQKISNSHKKPSKLQKQATQTRLFEKNKVKDLEK